jgi:ATP-dependent RNA helicase SUPV3L1/SUV3
MIELAYDLDKRNTLKLEDKYLLAQAPTNTKSPLLKDAYSFYVNAIINKKRCDYRLYINIKTLAKSELDLLKAEDEVKKISLYLWLSYKLPEIFYDIENAYKYRVLVNKYCEDSLKLNLKELNGGTSSFKRKDGKGDFRRDKPSVRDDGKRKTFTKNDTHKKDIKEKSFRNENKTQNKTNDIKKHKIKKKEDYA